MLVFLAILDYRHVQVVNLTLHYLPPVAQKHFAAQIALVLPMLLEALLIPVLVQVLHCVIEFSVSGLLSKE